MNRKSCGYLVRALNELASLTAQCKFDDVDRAVGAKTPSRTGDCHRSSRNLDQRWRSRYRNRRARAKFGRVNAAVPGMATSPS
jgi:hypothetical protein